MPITAILCIRQRMPCFCVIKPGVGLRCWIYLAKGISSSIENTRYRRSIQRTLTLVLWSPVRFLYLIHTVFGAGRGQELEAIGSPSTRRTIDQAGIAGMQVQV